MTFPGEVGTPAPVDSPYDFNSESKEARATLSDHAMGLARQASQATNSIDTGTLVAAGTGLAVGGVATALGQIGLTKGVESMAKSAASTIFGTLAGPDVGAAILHSAGIPWYKCLTPKPVAIGGAVVATLAVGGYELYKHLGSSGK